MPSDCASFSLNSVLCEKICFPLRMFLPLSLIYTANQGPTQLWPFRQIFPTHSEPHWCVIPHSHPSLTLRFSNQYFLGLVWAISLLMLCRKLPSNMGSQKGGAWEVSLMWTICTQYLSRHLNTYWINSQMSQMNKKLWGWKCCQKREVREWKIIRGDAYRVGK